MKINDAVEIDFDFDRRLKDVDISSIIQMEVADKIGNPTKHILSEDFYEKSGLKILFTDFMEKSKSFFPNLRAVFIENSTISTVIPASYLNAFKVVWISKEFKEEKKFYNSFSNNYFPIIKYLQDERANILWHKKLFIKPKKPIAYWSRSTKWLDYSTKDTKEISEKYKNKTKVKSDTKLIKLDKDFENGSLYVLNSFLEMSYEEVIEKSNDVSKKKIHDLQRLNHQVYHENFLSNNNESIFISIPLLGAPAGLSLKNETHRKRRETNKYNGQGAIFILLVLPKDSTLNEAELKDNLKKLSRQLIKTAKNTIINFIFKSGLNKAKLARKLAIKSIISSIISRNLSHTDGSHVMPTFDILYQQRLKSIDESLLKNLQESMTRGELSVDEILKKFKQELNESTEGLLYDFELYNNYLKEAMEYSADVSGGIASQILFSNSIGDVFRELKILLDTFLGKGLLDNTKSGPTTSIDLGGMNSSDKIKEVDFPGGRTGVVAFLSILKNYIRNCHKHARNAGDAYEIKIKIKEPKRPILKNDFWEITIFEARNTKAYEEKQEDVLSINKEHIDQDILDKDNVVRSTGWGILEMKIAAAYLTRFPLGEIDSRSKKGIVHLNEDENKKKYPHLLEAIVCDEKGERINSKPSGSSHLGYKFYLLKPKTCLVLSDDLHLNQEKRKLFESKGFNFQNRDFDPFNCSHKFVLKLDYKKTEYVEEDNIRTIYDKGDFKKMLKEESPDNVFQKLWKSWIEEKFSFYKKHPVAVAKSRKISLDHPKNLSKHILFDNHGKHIFIDEMNFNHATYQDLKGKFLYYESFNTRGKVGGILSNAFPPPKKEETPIYTQLEEESITYLQLMESVHTKAAIIDERIQEKVDGTETNKNRDSNQPGMILRELLDLSGVYIPALLSYNKKIRPYPKEEIYTVKEYSNWEPKFLEDKLKYYAVKKKCEYIVLHLTVFEAVYSKVLRKNASTKPEAYLAKLKKLVGSSKIVFTSGKGTPKTLPQGSYFISLSTLEQFVTIRRNKFELINQLKSLRKIIL